MADKTSNYNLIKPEENETADISVINNNFDIIDTKIKENNDHINNAKEDIGNTSNLNTKEKSSLVGAVNEVSASMADIAYKTVSGTANAITISKQGFTLTDGQYVEFKATANNTGNMTIKVNDEAVKFLRNEDGEQLSSEDIEANKYYKAIYNSDNDFFLLAPRGGGDIFFSKYVGSGEIQLYDKPIKVNQYIYASNDVVIQTPDNMIQKIPSIYNAESESQLIVNQTGMLKVMGITGKTNV
ncbi:MAG: hypothetical protein N4A63_12850, partial [Vallitalea sp.]|nr:hypothetical protein [Vallitalea sp.]